MESNGWSAASQAARTLASMRHRVEGDCVVCGAEFTGTLKRRYCSHVCAQRAYWSRKQHSAKRERGLAGTREEREDGKEQASG